MNLKEKKNLLKEEAIKLGLCSTCLKKEAENDKKQCKKCLDKGRKAAIKNRERSNLKRKAEGNCSRCGKLNSSTKYKTCNACRALSKKKGRELKKLKKKNVKTFLEKLLGN